MYFRWLVHLDIIMVSVVGGYSELIKVGLAIEAAHHRHAHLTHSLLPKLSLANALRYCVASIISLPLVLSRVRCCMSPWIFDYLYQHSPLSPSTFPSHPLFPSNTFTISYILHISIGDIYLSVSNLIKIYLNIGELVFQSKLHDRCCWSSATLWFPSWVQRGRRCVSSWGRLVC